MGFVLRFVICFCDRVPIDYIIYKCVSYDATCDFEVCYRNDKLSFFVFFFLFL